MLIFKKEKKVASLANDFVEAVAEGAKLARKVVREYLEHALDEAERQTAVAVEAEGQADDRLAEIRAALYDGAFLPTIREDIFRLLQTVDQVSNACEEVSKHFVDQRPEVPPELKAAFQEVADASCTSVKPLKKAIQCYFDPKEKTDTVKDYIRETVNQESTVDALERKLTREIFAFKTDLAHKQHLRRTLHKVVRISDRAEDACDELELTVLKSII